LFFTFSCNYQLFFTFSWNQNFPNKYIISGGWFAIKSVSCPVCISISKYLDVTIIFHKEITSNRPFKVSKNPFKNQHMICSMWMHELAYKVDYTAYIGLRNYKINNLSYHPLIKLWLFKEFIIHCHLQFKLAIKHIYFCRFKNNLLGEVTVYIARKYLRAPRSLIANFWWRVCLRLATSC
jgi:hypothetical protein